jgi:hypothetical protein
MSLGQVVETIEEVIWKASKTKKMETITNKDKLA